MKKIISFVLAVLLVLSIVSSKALPVSAATLEGTPSADDVEDVLDDIISISNNLKSVGFSIEDITGLLQLSEGSAGYGADAHIENIGNENTIQALYNYDGNPPSSDAEQKERIVDAFAMALSVPARNYYQGSLMTADELGNFVVYLYLSNYVDGPGRAPTMNDLPYIITTYDITAYNNFLSVSNAASLFNGLSSFASSLYSTSTFVNDAAAISDFSDDIADLAALIYAAGNGVYDAEQLHAAYDLISDKVVWYTNQNAADINDDVEVFINDTIDYVHTE